MKLKKILCLIIALSLTSVALEGCTKKENAESGDKITITWMGAPFNESASEGTEAEKLIEERFNVEIKPLFYPKQNYNDKKTMLMASGEIPDVIYETDPSFLAGDVAQGFLAEIDYKKIAEKAPTLYKNIADEEPKAWLYSRVAGKNYGIPNLTYSNQLGRLGLWRTDWLKNVGIDKVPETIDEMHDALLKITKNDPDNNGKNDTYGMSGDISSWHTMFSEVFGAYGVLPYNWMLQDNKVIYGGFANGITDAIDTLAQWYAEGIIHPDFTTDNVFSSGKEKFTSGIVGYINQGGGYIDPFETTSIPAVTKGIFPNAEVESSKFVKGPDGKSGTQCWGIPCHIVSFGVQLEKDEAKLNKILEIFETFMTDEEFLKAVKLGKEGTIWNYRDSSKGFKGGIDYIAPYDDGDQRTKACIDQNFGSPSFFVPVTPLRTVYNEFVSEEQEKFIEDYAQIENGLTDIFIKPDVLASSPKYFENLRLQQINLIVKAIKGEITSQQYIEQFKKVWEQSGGKELEQEADALYSEEEKILIEILNK